ncbi:MAG TPA: hypothetical protein PKZ86_00320 [Smithella sp.]|nr:hypothetical protein [Smithella sp.]HQH15550.1 hypothetical protein [Smithella sp.]
MAKKISLIFLNLLVFTFILPFGAFAEADGFGDLKWGTYISTLEDLRYVRTDPNYGGIEIYSREGDELKFVDHELKSLEYGFWQDKFYSVSMKFQGDVNISSFVEKFDLGYKPDSLIERYVWSSELTRMLLEYSEASREWSLFISSKEINIQQIKYDSEKVRSSIKVGLKQKR